jgi:serine/threonine protein kinase
MPEIGQTISHYKIVEKIGQGGMGEVYLAEDLFLDRKVALKFLPEVFTGDPERMARFEREAKLLASLNHPNIAVIHGLEQADGKRFIVLEYVKGKTLQAKLSKGPLPVEEVLGVCRQIAEALEAAHEKGVIHRDLKPANVMITAEEKVKILDFGLAKGLVDEGRSVDSSQSPTLTEAMTQPGVILGTSAYMSPEQARGKTVDKRADIWAFGCILYECSTGKKAFEGGTVSDTLASVLAREPEWQSLPQIFHPRIRLLLERCLKKEPNNRCRDIGDARLDIQEVLADPSGMYVKPVAMEEPQKKPRTMLPWLAVAVVLTALITGAVIWHLKSTSPLVPPPVTRFIHELDNNQQFNNLLERNLAISPDGKQFVYSTNMGLCLRSMDQLDTRLLPGTIEAQNPFFSPDGQWIGYWSSADKKIEKISISGGAPVPLTNAAPTGFIAWIADDAIVYGESGKGIMQISENGGTPEIILKADGREIFSPQILPDGKSILFTHLISRQQVKVMVQSLESGMNKELFSGDTAYYLSTGHIVYALGNDLLAVHFDPDKLKTTGGSFPVVKGVLRATSAPQYAVSDSGTLIYAAGTATSSQRNLVWVDRNGNEELLEAEPKSYTGPRISPDGMQLAVTVDAYATEDIWIWDMDRKMLTPLTSEAAGTYAPLWSPDGKQIAYASLNGVNSGVYLKAVDEAGGGRLLCSASGIRLIPYTWSDNGKALMLMEITPTGTNAGIVTLSMEGDSKPKPLLLDKHAERRPQVSPDGQLLAYTSNMSGKNEVYVRQFPKIDGRRLKASKNGGQNPLWSPDGRELFYRSGDAVMAVAVETEPMLSLGTPVILFRDIYAGFTTDISATTWDISPDGKRFLMMKDTATESAEETARDRIIAVLNWFEELKERVPVE